jgi:hypothetical protein
VVFATFIVKLFQFLLMSITYSFTPKGKVFFQLFPSLFPLLLLFDSLGIIVNLGLSVDIRGLVCVSGDGL